ncbi:MAG TPA: hemerythrin domain-containing protein [Micromonosporaceae bacterium]|nr:hemerythrin domain-containing protein [Micromonosporaceae bacterium]
MTQIEKDVVDLIMQDHRDLQQIFARLRTGDGDPALLFPEMAALLTAHSRAEEAEVYPAVAKAGDAEEVKHAREEHAEADDLLSKLKKLAPDSAEFANLLNKLMDAVDHHIEEEESAALPALRTGVDATRMAQLAEAFTNRRGEELESGPSPRQVGGSEMTKEKLYQKAVEHDIPGRSGMTKEELSEAVKAVEGEE